MLMPMELQLTFADGTSETVRLPVEMWKMGPSFVYRLPTDRVLVGVTIDPRGVYPDDDRGNNVWGR
jgi:virulence-associated protein VagC